MNSNIYHLGGDIRNVGLESKAIWKRRPKPKESPAAPPSPHYESPPHTAPAKPSQPLPVPLPPRVLPPPPHAVIPPPPPHNLPPPLPPSVIPPPPPHAIPPPPTPPPGCHNTIIVVVFVSCGGVFFLAFMMAALWCFLKKKKKMVRKAENVHIDEHRKIRESMVQGPHGEHVILSVEDDIHIEEDIEKSGVGNFRKGLDVNYVAGLFDQPAAASSSSTHHQHSHKEQFDLLFQSKIKLVK